MYVCMYVCMYIHIYMIYMIHIIYIYIYIYHLHGVFLAGYGWFEGKILYFNTQIRVYHILFTDRTTDYVPAEDFGGIDLILL